MRRRKYFLTLLFTEVIVVTSFFYGTSLFIKSISIEEENVVLEDIIWEEKRESMQEETLEEGPSPTQEMPAPKILKNQDVPFVVQAPGGFWENPRYQDGCEEASLLMAFSWVQGKEIKNPALTLDEISYAMEERLGTFYDTSIEDTFLFAHEYLDGEGTSLKKDVVKNDLIEELLRGNIVGITVNGQRLNNPYFTPPGPLYHMIILRGYDPETKEFIANDPGTKRGEEFRYQEDLLFSALQNYTTGKKGTIFPEEKHMIVFQREGEW